MKASRYLTFAERFAIAAGVFDESPDLAKQIEIALLSTMDEKIADEVANLMKAYIAKSKGNPAPWKAAVETFIRLIATAYSVGRQDQKMADSTGIDFLMLDLKADMEKDFAANFVDPDKAGPGIGPEVPGILSMPEAQSILNQLFGGLGVIELSVGCGRPECKRCNPSLRSEAD